MSPNEARTRKEKIDPALVKEIRDSHRVCRTEIWVEVRADGGGMAYPLRAVTMRSLIAGFFSRERVRRLLRCGIKR